MVFYTHRRLYMFMIDYKELAWQYWFITACFLTAGIAGYQIGFYLAIGLTIIQTIHFAIRKKSIIAFPVQVRFSYLILLLIALPQPMQFIYWIPTIGTWAQEIFGYCAMARLVSLFPWNREIQLSLNTITKTFFSKPIHGSVAQETPNKLKPE